LLLEPALLTVQHALQANLMQEPQMTLHLAIGVAATTDGQKKLIELATFAILLLLLALSSALRCY